MQTKENPAAESASTGVDRTKRSTKVGATHVRAGGGETRRKRRKGPTKTGGGRARGGHTHPVTKPSPEVVRKHRPATPPGCVPDADCRPTSPRWMGRQAEQPGYAQGRTPTVKMRQFPVAQREPMGCCTDPSEATEVAEGRQGSEIEVELRRQMARIKCENKRCTS